MKRAHLVLPLLAIVCAVLTAPRAQPIVIYNPSQSVPSGFYVRSGKAPQRGDLATIASVSVAPGYAALRDFADRSDRFLKRIAAGQGQTVCAEGRIIVIDGASVAVRIERDGEGRMLPRWEGCRTLAADEVFLLGDTAESFDGRYWGPTPRALIESAWTRL